MSEDPKLGFLPASVAVPLGRIKERFAALPRSSRILAFTTLAAALALVGYFYLRTSFEPYAVLYNQMEKEDAGALVAKLKELKVPYRLAADGSTVEVPEARVHELRLELATLGLPRGGGIGFESFDKTHLGATEFEQKVMFRRALEGELARTIGSIGAVQSARVHLVLPEKSVFVSKSEPASASIVVRLRAGRTLGAPEVSGVVHVAASSVPGLAAERITLVTSEGVMLHRPSNKGAEPGGDDPENPSQARTLETLLEERARHMLERVTGAGHVDVRVTAEVDTARVEHVEDHYDPTKSTLRSEERNLERDGSDTSVAGVPGAESNLPAGAGAAKPAGTADPTTGILRDSHTRNYEVDHVFEKRVATAGSVKRLTVAVLIDGTPKTEGGHTVMVPRTKEEIDRFAALVRSAVGADEKRGDLVTVDSVAFLDLDAAAAEAMPQPTAGLDWKKYKKQIGIGAGVFVLGTLFFVIRGMRRRKAKAALALPESTETPVLEPAIVDPDKVDADGVEIEEATTVPMDYRAEAMERAAKDPATAALVLRAWLGTAEAENTPSVPVQTALAS